MATHTIAIMGPATKPDATGECFFPAIDQEMTLGTSPAKHLVFTLKDPSADAGFYGGFRVPELYVGTPKIIVGGYLDGTIAATQVAWGFSYRALADNEALDQAWQETVTFNTGSLSGGSYTDEDYCEKNAALSANFAANDWVPFYFFRDFSEDTFVGDFHGAGLWFQFADA